MILKPKGVCSKEDLENKLIIEKWMKRNSSSRVTIGQNIVKPDDSNESSNLVSKTKDPCAHNIALSVSKTKVMKIGPQVVLPSKISDSKSKESDHTGIKRTHDFMSGIIQLSVSKVVRQSLPSDRSELREVNKAAPLNTTKIVSRKSEPLIKNKKSVAKVSCRVEPVKNATNKPTVKEDLPPNPAVKFNVSKPAPSVKTGVKIMENDLNNKNSIKNVLSKEKDTDVYTSLLDNYRYLITPKSWSVSEFTSETKNRYIVFFNAQVIKENDTLISVIEKSLIIDKGATMNYSVHGLPVDIKGTILPKTLDNTKKLLSILHIFDKMQVCNGLGNDLHIMQTDFVFKDNCRHWRHKNCKIVLLKATRCPLCTKTRTLILDSNAKCKKEASDLPEFLGIKVKLEEQPQTKS